VIGIEDEDDDEDEASSLLEIRRSMFDIGF